MGCRSKDANAGRQSMNQRSVTRVRVSPRIYGDHRVRRAIDLDHRALLRLALAPRDRDERGSTKGKEGQEADAEGTSYLHDPARPRGL